MATDRFTIADVNARLAAAGYAERFVRGRGYFYFYSGGTSNWPSTMVEVYRLHDMTLDAWVAEFHRLRADSYTEEDAADSRAVLAQIKGGTR